MVTITPQALPQPVPGTTSPNPVVTFSNPAAALAALGGNTAVQVAVTASQPTSAGAVLLLQVAGQSVEVRSPVTLAPGTQAELKLLPAANGTKAQLVLPDTGKTTGNSGGTSSAARSDGNPAIVTIRGTLQATVIRPAAGASSPAAPSAPTAAAAATPPAATGPTTASGAPPATPTATTTPPLPAGSNVAPASTAAAPAVTPQTFVPGSTLTVRPLPAGSSASSAATTVLTATVASTSSGGTSLLTSPAGTLSLNLPDAPPPGGQVRLEILEILPAPLTNSPVLSASGLRGLGDTLLQVMQVLSRTNPDAARELASRLPQASPELAANLTRMISGLRLGQVGPVIGDTVMQILERSGRGGLLARIREDVQSARQTGGENNDWRSYQLPFLNGQEIEPIRLHLHHPEDDDGKPDPDQATKRFLIDLDLSNIGPLQIDGLIGDQSLDLILRTTVPMPGNFMDDLNLIYITALEAVGKTGRLTFRHDEPLIEILPAAESRPGFFV